MTVYHTGAYRLTSSPVDSPLVRCVTRFRLGGDGMKSRHVSNDETFAWAVSQRPRRQEGWRNQLRDLQAGFTLPHAAGRLLHRTGVWALPWPLIRRCHVRRTSAWRKFIPAVAHRKMCGRACQSNARLRTYTVLSCVSVRPGQGLAINSGRLSSSRKYVSSANGIAERRLWSPRY